MSKSKSDSVMHQRLQLILTVLKNLKKKLKHFLALQHLVLAQNSFNNKKNIPKKLFNRSSLKPWVTRITKKVSSASPVC